MTEIQYEFMRDIIENPFDDTPRLIYADWLEDNGKEDAGQAIRDAVLNGREPCGNLHSVSGSWWMGEGKGSFLPVSEYSRLPTAQKGVVLHIRRGFVSELVMGHEVGEEIYLPLPNPRWIKQLFRVQPITAIDCQMYYQECIHDLADGSHRVIVSLRLTDVDWGNTPPRCASTSPGQGRARVQGYLFDSRNDAVAALRLALVRFYRRTVGLQRLPDHELMA